MFRTWMSFLSISDANLPIGLFLHYNGTLELSNPRFSYLPFDPIMAVHALMSPTTAYFYRIRGPHPWSGARNAILTIEDRVVKVFLIIQST